MFSPKYRLVLFILLFSWISGFNQSLPPSTIGQVYNFEVGDTFEYQQQFQYPFFTPCATTETYYYFDIITAKQQSGDTIIYQEKEYQWYQESCVPGNETGTASTDSGTQILTVFNTDSSVLTLLGDTSQYVYFLQLQDSSDCDSVGNCFGDSVYMDHHLNNIKFDSYSASYADDGFFEEIFADGLGTYYVINGVPAFVANDEYDADADDYTQLIYCHKIDGTIFGNPYFFDWITAVPDIPNPQIFAELFPNPADNNMNFQITGSFIPPFVLKFFDVTGRVAKQLTITNPTTQMERGNLPNGIYFWELESNEQVLSHGKLVLK